MTFIDPQLIRRILDNYKEPLVFKGYLENWRILRWTLNDWDKKLGATKLKFRKYNFIKSSSPIWEQTCTTTSLTMKEFIKFQNNTNNDYWLYFDYKYMEEWFKNYSDILNDVSWAKFGHPELTGKDSSIWIGSKGSHTPCHVDTYGCNLVAQIYGRKRWLIFPPSEDLKPTRVPYEESSVYSKLNFFSPNVSEFNDIQNARMIYLNPGDVLFVPVGWWHYVENVETAISINTWLPQMQDHGKRVEEAFTQILVSQLTKILDRGEQTMILNPNSMDIHDQSLSNCINLLERTIEIYKDKMNESLTISTVSNVSSILSITNIDNIVEENDTVHAVPTLSREEFNSFLQEQERKYDSCQQVENDEPKSSTVSTIEKLINAVCHPDVLKLIREKLLEE